MSTIYFLNCLNIRFVYNVFLLHYMGIPIREILYQISAKLHSREPIKMSPVVNVLGRDKQLAQIVTAILYDSCN